MIERIIAGNLRISAMLIVLGVTSTVRGDVIWEHVGDADPTTEGWSALGTPTAVGIPLGSDLADPSFAAWSVTDGRYFGPISQALSDQGTAMGWTLRARVRAIDPGEIIDTDIIVGYGDGTTMWSMNFTQHGGGLGTFVQLDPGPLGPTFAAPDNLYHLYELVYDPVANNVGLFVDGDEKISNHGGFLSPQQEVLFGDGSTGGSGEGRYAQVQLDVVPEPSTLILFATAGACLLGYSWRRKRKMPV